MCESRLEGKIFDFEDINEHIGNNGIFQKKFGLIFVGVVTALVSSQYVTKIGSLAVPDHWCHVPGREGTNYTLAEWKNITIPKITSNGIESFSKCTRFASNENQNETIQCDYGWEYDHTWHSTTASIQNNWVCDDYMVATKVLALNRAAEVIGTILLGQLADNVGRRPVFLIGMSTVLIARIASLFTSSWVYLFIFFNFLSSFPITAISHAPLIIAMEMSGSNHRTLINAFFGCGWALGESIAPLVMWWQHDWIIFSLITTLPCFLFIFCHRLMMESPRWLASRGKTKSCIKVLSAIAKTNKTELPSDIAEILSIAESKQDSSKIRTLILLFSSIRLAKNVVILVFGLSAITLAYMCLLLNINTFGGNPYLIFFLFGLMPTPMFCINKYACDRFGRRMWAIFGYLLTSMGYFSLAALSHDPNYSVYMTVLCICTKLFCWMAHAGILLLVVEICPTCVRQSGTSLAAIVANMLCIIGPFIVAMGISANVRIPYLVNGCLLFAAFICCIFLPETQGRELPDTLEDAAKFGRDQDIWGRAKMEKQDVYSDVPLNE